LITVQIGKITLGVEGRRWRILDDGGQPHLAAATRDRLNVEAQSVAPDAPTLFEPERPSPDLDLARRAVADRPDARIVTDGEPEREQNLE
jgi:hypothetical protein